MVRSYRARSESPSIRPHRPAEGLEGLPSEPAPPLTDDPGGGPKSRTGAFFVPSVASPLTMQIDGWMVQLASEVSHLRKETRREPKASAPPPAATMSSYVAAEPLILFICQPEPAYTVRRRLYGGMPVPTRQYQPAQNRNSYPLVVLAC